MFFTPASVNSPPLHGSSSHLAKDFLRVRNLRCWVERDEQIFMDVVTCALAFPLLRISGYEVSSDPLAEISNKGDFKDEYAALDVYHASEVDNALKFPINTCLERIKHQTKYRALQCRRNKNFENYIPESSLVCLVVHKLLLNYISPPRSKSGASDTLISEENQLGVLKRVGSAAGVVLNQIELACVQMELFDKAADVFEEAKGVLEVECSSHHPNTIAVYNNLVGTYDAIGR